MQKSGVAMSIDFDSDFDGNLSMDYTLSHRDLKHNVGFRSIGYCWIMDGSILQDDLGRKIVLLCLGECSLELSCLLDFNLPVDVVEGCSVKHLDILADISSLHTHKLSLACIR